MDNTSIKKNIRHVRKSKRFTQEDMAHKLGMSLTAYRDLEKGETAILNNNLKKVAKLLETTSEELVLGYRPTQMQVPCLEDVKEEYSSRISFLENRISELENITRLLEETIASKNEIISTKNEIISMLKKSLDADK